MKFVENTPLAGGSICKTSRVKSETGEFYVLKTLSSGPRDLFKKEAEGLKALRDSGCVKVPRVIEISEKHLLLEWIPTGKNSEKFWQRLGESLANLHKSKVNQIGFSHNNYIGSNLQKNTPYKKFEGGEDWIDFFWDHRLGYQLGLLPDGDLSDEVRQWMDSLKEPIYKILDSDEEPCLLHGDLWSGNILASESEEAFLIDPAVYYGHREADLAMTQLFGTFHYVFYESYQKAYPLKPGWPARLKIYQLYHLLNHWNLFGESYHASVKRVLKDISS